MCCCAIFCTRFHREQWNFHVHVESSMLLGRKSYAGRNKEIYPNNWIDLWTAQHAGIFHHLQRNVFIKSSHIFQSPLLSSFISSLIISRVVVESTIKSRSFLSCNKRKKPITTLSMTIAAVNRYTFAQTRGFYKRDYKDLEWDKALTSWVKWNFSFKWWYWLDSFALALLWPGATLQHCISVSLIMWRSFALTGSRESSSTSFWSSWSISLNFKSTISWWDVETNLDKWSISWIVSLGLDSDLSLPWPFPKNFIAVSIIMVHVEPDTVGKRSHCLNVFRCDTIDSDYLPWLSHESHA